MDNEWKNSLRERFSDYSVPEPEGLWEGIEQGMAEKSRRKLLPVWLVSGAAVAAAVALVVFLHPDKKVESPVAPDSIERYAQDVPVDSESVVSADEVILDNESAPSTVEESKPVPFAVTSRQTLLSDAIPDSSVSVPVSDETIPDAVHEIVPYTEVPVSETKETTIDQKETTLDTEEISYGTNRVYGSIVDTDGNPVIGVSVIANRRRGQGTVTDAEGRFSLDVQPGTPLEIDCLGYKSVSVTSGSGMRVVLEDDDTVLEEREVIGYGAGGRGGFSIGAYQAGGQDASEQSQGFGLGKTGPMYARAVTIGSKQSAGSLMSMLSSNQASSFEAHHSAPMRVGLTFAWNMTPHLSLASGLNWTSLTSTFEESTTGMRRFTRQNLGYLGVPLRLEAGIRPWKGLRLYAGAGGMVEKGLMAHSVTDSYIGDYLEESIGKHPDTGGLLWSVGASAGAEYRFNRVFGIYFAPGIEYHFDNGSGVQSAYTEKPLHWNLSLGVRFNIQK